jgi:hypothetical protein
MSFEEELKFMGMLIQMGFSREYVLWAMLHLSKGYCIAEAMLRAVNDTTSHKDFPEHEN